MNFLIIIILNILLITIFSIIAKKINLVDIPNERKLHIFNVPLIGGICIYLSVLISIFIFGKIDIKFYNILIYFSGLIVILGILDDFKNINYKIRIVLIFFICYIFILLEEIYLINLGVFFNLQIVNLGFFGVIITIFSVFALVNAFNFLDGIDGLTSMQSIVILLFLLFYNSYFELNNDLTLIYYLITSLIIFFIFNLIIKNKFKIFLGDAGSMFLGFIISWIIIFLSQKENPLPVVLVPWIISFPIFDLISTVVIRLYKKKSPFKPDHYHFHYILLKHKKLNSLNINLVIFILFFSLNIFGLICYNFLIEEITFIIFVILFFIFHFYKWKIIKKI